VVRPLGQEGAGGVEVDVEGARQEIGDAGDLDAEAEGEGVLVVVDEVGLAALLGRGRGLPGVAAAQPPDDVAAGGGGLRILGLEGAVPIEGGLPLVMDGKIIGAIGVSGATAQQDGMAAKAGADALK